MAYEANTGATGVNFGNTLRIGYRINGSSSAFTYLTHFPGYNELPYTYSLPTSGTWEIEYAQICPSCSGSKYSNVETTIVVIP